MNFLKKIFNKKEFKLNWIDFKEKNFDHYPRLLNDILDKKKDGLRINNFLNENEIEFVLNNLLKIDKEKMTQVQFGRILGDSILGAINLSLKEKILSQSEEFEKKTNEIFGFNIHKRLLNLFKEISQYNIVKVYGEENRKVNFANFRFFHSKGFGLTAHTGNEFLGNENNISTVGLAKTLKIYDGLSFFMYLQVPESGGELVLYNLNWHDKVEGLEFHGDGKGDDSFIEKYEKVEIQPKAGDLIIFRGGDIWHKVRPIKGDSERITFGGFISPSLDGKRLECFT